MTHDIDTHMRMADYASMLASSTDNREGASYAFADAKAMTTVMVHMVDHLNRSNPGLEAMEAAALISAWKEIGKNLNALASHYSSDIATHLSELSSTKNKSFQIDILDPSTEDDLISLQPAVVTPVTKVSRKEVDAPGMVKALRRRVQEDKTLRVNTDTGEILSEEAAMLIQLDRVFRFVPRYTELKAVGINDDEYCTKTTKIDLEIRELGTA